VAQFLNHLHAVLLLWNQPWFWTKLDDLATKLKHLGLQVLCKEAKIDYNKPAKAAAMIQGSAALMQVSIGETTIKPSSQFFTSEFLGVKG